MSEFARSRPWVGMAAAAADSTPPSQPGARDDADAASSAPTNSRAISFGFAATAVLVSLFLLMAIFEHLIKPGLASSSSSSRHDHDEEGRGEDGNSSSRGSPLATSRHRHRRDVVSPVDKLRHPPKVEEPVTGAADLPVLMPGHRYPTFLAQPAPLPPCPREGVRWPTHDHLQQRRHPFVPP